MGRSAYLKQLYEPWLAAGVLVSLDRREDALHRLAGSSMTGGRSCVGIRPLRTAEICEERGDRERVKHDYGRFVRYWTDADPGLQRRTAQTRRRMESL